MRLSIAATVLSGAAAFVTVAGPHSWFRASTASPIAPRAYHVVGFNDTGVYAIGGETTSAGSLSTTMTPYAVGNGFKSEVGLAAPSLLTGTVSYAARRAAFVSTRSTTDVGPTGWALLAFGGLDGSGTAINTAARYNYATRGWSVFNASGTPPTPRSLAAAAFLPRCANVTGGPAQGCMVVVGGLSATSARLGGGAVLFVDGLSATSKPAWVTPPTLALNAPSPRHSASMITGLDGNSAVLFGGETNAGVTNDVFLLTPAGFSPPLPSEMTNLALGKPAGGSALDPVWGGPYTRATDGNVAGVVNPAPNAANANNPIYNFCTSSIRGGAAANGQPLGTPNPFLWVDLGADNTPFDGVTFFSRTDCASTNQANPYGALDCSTREAGFQIAYGNSNVHFSAPGNFMPGYPGYTCVTPPENLEGGNAYVSCPGASGRYVWVYLPGANRVLTVCELQVMRAQPWAWRALSAGSAPVNVAASALASQSSQFYSAAVGGVGTDANLAIDGQTSNDWFSGTCAHTDNTLGAGATQTFRLNFGRPVDVQSVSIWPVSNDIDSTSPAQRNIGWQISIGNSITNPALNTACTAVPATLTAPSTSFPCVASGQYLVITRVVGQLGVASNAIAMCEIQVFARPLSGAPAPRAGAAATGYGGQMVVFGGYGAGGARLNDLAMFDLTRLAWRPAAPPLGGPPDVRSYGGLVPLYAMPVAALGGLPVPSGRVALMGGAGPLAPLGDVWELRFPGCPPLSATLLGGVDPVASRFYYGASVWWPVCTAGYTDANAGGPLICDPTGTWVGVVPPCTARPPGPPSAPAAVPGPATSSSVGNAVVSWGPPSDMGALGVVDYYSVRSLVAGTNTLSFNPATAAAPLSPGGYWVDTTAVVFAAGDRPIGANSYFTGGGWLSMVAASGSYCLGAVNRCPKVLMNFTSALPAGVPLSAYMARVAVESRVRLSEQTSFPYYEVGLGLFDVSKPVGGAQGAFEFILTLYRTRTYTAACAYSPHSPAWATDENCILVSTTDIGSEPTLYLRLERSPATGGVWEGFFRVSASRNWITFGRFFGAPQALGGVLLDANLRAGLFVMQEENFFEPNLLNEHVMGDFDYLTIMAADCARPGQHRTVPGNNWSAVVSGLTPSATGAYGFAITACAFASGCGAAANTPTLVLGAYAPAPNVTLPNKTNGLWVEVGRGKPAAQTSTFQTAVATLAVDGNRQQNDAAGVPGFAHACAITTSVADGAGVIPYWRLDLGTTTDIAHFTIYNRADFRPDWLTGLQVFVGDNTDWTEAEQCDLTSLNNTGMVTAPFVADFDCPSAGRFVYVRTGRFDSRLQLCEVQVWASNACPALVGINTVTAPGSQCGATGNATFGSVCTQSCAPGYIPVTGSAVSTCRGRTWTSLPLHCELPCAANFVRPANLATLRTTILSENFADPPAEIADRWAPLDARQTWGAFWAITDGTLQAAGSPSCGADMSLVSGHLAVAAQTGAFLYHGLVYTGSRAGLLFRSSSSVLNNGYRYVIDVHEQTATFELVTAGLPTRLMEVGGVSQLRTWTWYELQVYASGATFTFLLNGTQIMTATDATLATGFAGVYAEDRAQFDDLWMLVDSADCSAVVDGGRCEMTCLPGYIPTGAMSLKCIDGAPSVWSAPPGNCSLPPPAAVNSSATTPESCPALPAAMAAGGVCAFRTQLVGSPVGGAGSAVPGASLNYAIVGGNIANVSGVFYDAVFYVDNCGGQLFVNQPGGLVFAAKPVFTLLIQVSYADPSMSPAVGGPSAIGQVTVYVTPVAQPPVILPNQTIPCNENSPPGYTIPTRPAVAGSAANVTWRLAYDGGAGGRFVINPATGALSVAPNNSLPLNYEALPNAWVLTLSVALNSNPAATSSQTVLLQLVDQNDAPFYDGRLFFANDTAICARCFAGNPSSIAYQFADSMVPNYFLDEDTAPGFRGAPVVTELAPAAGWAACNLTDASRIPTSDGTLTGTPMFRLTTGVAPNPYLQITNAGLPPSGGFAGFAPFAYGGFLVRKVYDLCFTFTETGFPGVTYHAALQAVILADLADTPVINSMAMTNAAGAPIFTLSTYGGEFASFGFTGNPNLVAPAPAATYTNCPRGAAPTFGCSSYSVTCAYLINGTARSIRCPTLPGVGTNHAWNITFEGGLVYSSVPLRSSYALPVINNLTANTALATAGGTIVTINGANLGPFASVNDTTQVLYGAAYEYNCVPVAPLAGQDVQRQLRCSASVGAGSGLPFKLYAGNQVLLSAGLVGVPNPSFSYAKPAITLVSTAATFIEPALTNTSTTIRNLPTAGGTTLYVRGTNFGPALDPLGVPVPLTAAYGGISGTAFALTCARGAGALAHTQLTCTSAAGVGANLRMSIAVALIAGAAPTAGNASNQTGVSYAAPVITALSGDGATGGPTAGGALLTVFALSTGPVGPLPANAVLFGRPGNLRFAPTACAVVVPHTGATVGQIVCATQPGTGAGLVSQLTIGGQASPVFATNLVSYGPPVVTGFTRPAGASITAFGTGGNETVHIAGMNFGPADGVAPLVVRYITGGILGRFGAGGNGSGAPGAPTVLSLVLTPSACVVSVPHTQLTCTTAAGAGANLEWFVNVDAVGSANPTTAYGAPVITSFTVTDPLSGAPLDPTAPLNPNLAYTFNLIGANFGSGALPVLNAGTGPGTGQNATYSLRDMVTAVSYGPTGTEYPLATWSHVNDGLITVTVGPATGTGAYFRVVVAGQASTFSPVFSFAATTITGLVPNHGPCANPPSNPTVITITALAPPVLDPLSSLRVLIGSGSTWAVATPVAPGTLGDLLTDTNADGSVNVTFALPPAWGGQGLGVRLVAATPGGETLAASPLTPLSAFSYDGPNVTAAYALPAVFAGVGAGGNATRAGDPATSLVFPCPWAPGNARWTCDGTRGTLYQIVLVGANFGANPAALSAPDPLSRHLDVNLAPVAPAPPPAPSSGPNASASSAPAATPAPAVWSEAGWVSPTAGTPTEAATVYYWSDSRIIAYTYAPVGMLSVRLGNIDYTGAPATIASPPTVFLQNAPIVSAIATGGTNVPSGGGSAAAPLSLTVSNLVAGVDAIAITVGGSACPLVSGPGGGPLGGDAASQAGAISAAGANPVPFYCVVPPGQGSAAHVIVTRTSLGQATSALTNSVSYAPPVTAAFAVLHYNPSPYVPGAPGWVAFPLTDPQNPPYVMMPTNGSLIQVSGYNLGTAPVLTISSGSRSLQLGGGANGTAGAPQPCPGSSPLGACWQFAVPPGQGSGAAWSAGGYSIVLSAGDQTSNTSAFFSYNYPIVTSWFTDAPLSGVPTPATKADGSPITLYLNGYDFGAPTAAFGETDARSAVYVLFYRPVDEPAPGGTVTTAFACVNTLRASHWLLECTLPVGSGAGLTLRVGAGFDEWWWGESTPGFSYDSPTIVEAYSALAAVVLPPNPCVSIPSEYYDNTANVTLYNTSVVCPPQPPNLLAFSLNGTALAPYARALAFTTANGVNAMAASWLRIVGGNATAAGQPLPQLTASSTDVVPLADGTPQYLNYITLYGTNFGVLAPGLHCPTLAWSARPPGSPSALCNSWEDYLGEGEVDGRTLVNGGRVVSWSHTQITYIAPAGMGLKDLDVSVRGGRLALPIGAGGASPLRPRLLYSAPSAQSATPMLIDTTGGTRVMLTGWGFGPVPRATNNPGLAIADPSSFRLPLSAAPSLPTYALRIDFGIPGAGGPPQCVSSATTLAGLVSPFVQLPFADCAQGNVEITAAVPGVSGATLSFDAPYGIGANRSMSIAVVDGGVVVARSPFLTLSYYPPTVTGPESAVVYVSPGAAPAPLTLLGFQFGSPAIDTAAFWSPTDRATSVSLSGVPCPGVSRSTFPGGSPGEGSLSCTVDALRTTTGPKIIDVTIAGQVAEVSAASGTSRTVTIGCRGGPFASGFFGRLNDTCAPCPTQGATCPGYLEFVNPAPARHAMPVVLAGWFNLNGSAAADCPPAMRYVNPLNPGEPARDVCIVPCSPAESCGLDNACATGYTGTRCASCAPPGPGSLGFYVVGQTCMPCPSGAQAALVGYILAIAAIAVLAYLSQRNSVHICSATIGIDFCQVIAIYGSTRVDWPRELKQLLLVLSAFNVNVEIVAPECYLPGTTFVTKFTGIVLLPVVMAALLLGVHVAALFTKMVVMGRRSQVMRHAHVLVASLLVLMYFLYLYESSIMLAVFDCAPTSPPDGNQYLFAVFEACGKAGGTQLTLLPWAIIGLIVYTAGYPLAVAWHLFRNRELIMEDQLLRAKGAGEDRLTNPHAYEFRKRYSVLYDHFTPDAFYWTLPILLRKFLIVLVPVMFNRSASFQMAAILMVLMCAYGLQVRNNPYMSAASFEGVLRAHAESSFSSAIHARIRASIAGIESRGRKKARHNLLDFNGRVDRGAVLGVLTSWLFDPNTVEAALLFGAAIVALMGIMFESEALASGYYGSARVAVSDVALAVIILGLVYWVAVICTEAAALLTERARDAALSRSRRSSKVAGGKGGKDADLGGIDKAPSGSRRSLLNSALGITDAVAAAAAQRGKEINTGKLDVALNPLFLEGGSSSSSAGTIGSALSASSMDAVRAFANAPPPMDMWRVIAGNYEDLHGQANAMAVELAAAKQALEKLRSGGGEDAPPTPGGGKGGGRQSKRMFDPIAAAREGGEAGGAGGGSTVVVNPAQRLSALSSYSSSRRL